MKIAILTGTFSAFSGIERQVQYQSERYLAQGHDVTIITFAGDLQPPEGSKLILLGLPQNQFIERLYRLFYVWLPWVIRRHAGLLKDVDLVVAHQYPMTAIAAAAKRRFGLEYVYHDHGLPEPSIFPGMFERLYMRFFIREMLPTIRWADRVVCISKYLQNEMQQRYGILATVEYDDYDHKRFHIGVDRHCIREKLKLGTRPVAVFVGRLSPHKNIHRLIEAFNRVDPVFHAILLIVGKKTFGNYAKLLERLASPSVIFAGYVPEEEVPDFYGAADAYVTASLWEGFDLPVVEARACGVPSVMFDIGPHPEIAKPDDILVPVNDIAAFASALEQQFRRSDIRNRPSQEKSAFNEYDTKADHRLLPQEI